MLAKRAFHRGVLVRKLEFMVIGGWGGRDNTLNSVELLDYKDDKTKWSP